MDEEEEAKTDLEASSSTEETEENETESEAASGDEGEATDVAQRPGGNCSSLVLFSQTDFESLIHLSLSREMRTI